MPADITISEAARLLNVPRSDQAVVAKVNGDDGLVDLYSPVHDQDEVQLYGLDTPEGLDVLRHSASHVMAQAVQRVYPGAKVTIGPSIKNGFYYDFDFDDTFKPEDFEQIEAQMAQVIEAKKPFERRVVTKQEAIELFDKMGEPYKVEIINDLDADTVSLYEHDGWVDLCRGPHLPHTGFLKAYKVLSVAGAYWRGDERNKMLQRVYGTAFPDRKQLRNHLQQMEEARKRDHRKLGPALDLISFNEEAGAGLAIYHPKGALLRTLLEQFIRDEHLCRGYQVVMGPTILKQELWERSGHFDNYRDNMYFTEVGGQRYGIKPMNCLAHMLIYKSRLRSYRDLPLRYFELGTVHRHEKSGVLHGLFRLRAFTQDDAHLICTPDQLDAEIRGVLQFIIDVFDLFGFPYEMEVSTRPAKAIGSDESWELATNALFKALEGMDIPYDINKGEGAFYGPKIDVQLTDSLGRQWQCATVQADFTMPERFGLTYVGEDGAEHRPVMIHRVVLGSVERFIGILIEHYGGAFPTWLAPLQAVVLTVTDAAIDHARSVGKRLMQAGIRVELDLRNEKIGYKIRHWQGQKVPYMLVIGKREAEADAVAPRHRSGKDHGAMPVDQFIEMIKKETTIVFDREPMVPEGPR
ncbi:MAG: threonine--tRNA ligase [Candidatus Alcyoniella australis]|nr:threonine--tRNA ligase [Candidatus Alcyoniella australis]